MSVYFRVFSQDNLNIYASHGAWKAESRLIARNTILPIGYRAHTAHSTLYCEHSFPYPCPWPVCAPACVFVCTYGMTILASWTDVGGAMNFTTALFFSHLWSFFFFLKYVLFWFCYNILVVTLLTRCCCCCFFIIIIVFLLFFFIFIIGRVCWFKTIIARSGDREEVELLCAAGPTS